MRKLRIGLVGARGYVGKELLTLLAAHPGFEVVLVHSRSAEGEVPGFPALRYENVEPVEAAGRDLDAYVLAVPDGESTLWVRAIDGAARTAVVVDLGSDHRFDDAWVYGQPERNRGAIRGATRIANPGCYATALQLAAAPLVADLRGPIVAFGVSGHSGAGTSPSERNDPAVLRDNLLPYKSVGHVHEREVSRQLGVDVRLHPNVAPFFRGIALTLSADLAAPTASDALEARYRDHYRGELLVTVTTRAPHVRDIAERHDVAIGGFAASRTRVVVHATIDNLRGGAASQAVRNLNLAFGIDERSGLG